MSFEKVNPSHPDKVADRIAGAIVDLAYRKTENPKIAVEVLIGHGKCHIITETSEHLTRDEIGGIVLRITDDQTIGLDYVEVPQDDELAKNQSEEIRCGDNGIFKGVPISSEEKTLSETVRELYTTIPTDGKYIYDETAGVFIACQSNIGEKEFKQEFRKFSRIDASTLGCFTVNPLGPWTGGTNVDTGATNRKLGSDMGRAVTGGGLHGKDLSKADVSVNIACHILAQTSGMEINALCAIGDRGITFKRADGDLTTFRYKDVVEMARSYINDLGGFEKLAEWGLI